MGTHDVPPEPGEDQKRAFTKALLEDVHALERMLATDMLETDVRRIGAEQEMFLVDEGMNPAAVSPALLEHCDEPRLTTELGQYNLEANLRPRTFESSCLRDMEQELREVVAYTRAAAAKVGAEVVLAGILPTLRKQHLGLDMMTPNPRYYELNRALMQLRGGDEFRIFIKGLDEFEMSHDNVMLEACNTSFQIHFQVAPAEFPRLYNAAQAVTGPVLAAAVNSPVLFGRRLWAETRIALFERSVDARSTAQQVRGLRPRVSFGDRWVKESVLEIFREDIALFRAVLATPPEESPLTVIERGEPPKLSALCLHNGTVYRWNRACYGIGNGRAHLRIENRALPSGPTIADEMANAAFYFGLMAGMLEQHEDISTEMEFDDAKANFFAAARHGLDAQFTWLEGRRYAAPVLILDYLIPMARAGLTKAGIDRKDAKHYLDIVEERVRTGMTGSRWALQSLAAMASSAPPDACHRALVRATVAQQQDGDPVHTWPPAALPPTEAMRSSFRTVGQFMSTDLRTLRPEDLVDLAASLMEWERIRHIPVENDEGKLVGLLSHRSLLRLIARGFSADGTTVSVQTIMVSDPITVEPQTPTLDAMHLMRENQLSCLPVVEDGRLVGLITERDLIDVSARLLEEFLREDPGQAADGTK